MPPPVKTAHGKSPTITTETILMETLDRELANALQELLRTARPHLTSTRHAVIMRREKRSSSRNSPRNDSLVRCCCVQRQHE